MVNKIWVIKAGEEGWFECFSVKRLALRKIERMKEYNPEYKVTKELHKDQLYQYDLDPPENEIYIISTYNFWSSA